MQEKMCFHGKGFNRKSKFKECHICDKLHHNLCIKGHVEDDTRFACYKCRPNSMYQTGQEDLQIQSIDDAVAVLVQNSARGSESDKHDLGGILDSSKQTGEESTTDHDDNNLDLDLGMPEPIVQRRNEALRRGKEKGGEIFKKTMKMNQKVIWIKATTTLILRSLKKNMILKAMGLKRR